MFNKILVFSIFALSFANAKVNLKSSTVKKYKTSKRNRKIASLALEDKFFIDKFNEFTSCKYRKYADINKFYGCTFPTLDPELTSGIKKRLSDWSLLSHKITYPFLCNKEELALYNLSKPSKTHILCFNIIEHLGVEVLKGRIYFSKKNNNIYIQLSTPMINKILF